MTKRFPGAILLTLSLVTVTAARPETGDPGPVEVMILGTFHFTGGGRDVVNAEVDDMLAPARQKEIEALVGRLEDFGPDKILLEMEPEDEAEFNRKYVAFLRGEHALGVNERQQLGMRLAARLGHEKLYGIDYSNGLDYRPALAAAKELEQQRLLALNAALIGDLVARGKEAKDLPLAVRLRRLNAADDGGHYGYLTIAQMGTVENPQGALQIIKWWERNLVMFARAALNTAPGDKILIVVGAGHLHLLRQFFAEARSFELVDPLPYLE